MIGEVAVAQQYHSKRGFEGISSFKHPYPRRSTPDVLPGPTSPGRSENWGGMRPTPYGVGGIFSGSMPNRIGERCALGGLHSGFRDLQDIVTAYDLERFRKAIEDLRAIGQCKVPDRLVRRFG